MEKKSQILEILGDGSWHDREQLSAQLGISGSELEAQLDSLRRSHPELRQVPELGVCLPREPQRYDRRLLEALAGRFSIPSVPPMMRPGNCLNRGRPMERRRLLTSRPPDGAGWGVRLYPRAARASM